MDQTFSRSYHASTLNSSELLVWLLNIKIFTKLHLVLNRDHDYQSMSKIDTVFDCSIKPNNNESMHAILVLKKL